MVCCACSRCGWRLFGHFSLANHFSLFSPSLWETARYRLNYCLKGPLKPNQPTNQLNIYRAVGPVVRERERERGQARERERERTGERNISKQRPSTPTASTLDPCPTQIQISRTPRHSRYLVPSPRGRAA